MKIIEKNIAVQTDIEQQDEGVISGYVSTYGSDLQGDDIKKGAYDAWLESAPDSIPMLIGHNKGELPVGEWSEFSADEKGLRGTGRFYLDKIAKAKECYELLKDEKLSGLSIGARINQYTRTPKGGLNIERMGVREVSIVLFPAQPAAQVDLVRGEKGEIEMPDIEKNLEVVEKGLAEAAEKATAVEKKLDERVEKYDGEFKTVSDRLATIEKDGAELKSMTEKSSDNLRKFLDKGKERGKLYEFEEKTDESGRKHLHIEIDQEVLREKAVSTIDSSAGAATGQPGTWVDGYSRDVFGMFAMHLPVNTPSFNFPRAGVGAFSAEATLTAHASATYGGANTNLALSCLNYTSRSQFSETLFDDVQSFEQRIVPLIIARQESHRSQLTAAKLKASANLTANRGAGQANEFAIRRTITDTTTTAATAFIDASANIILAVAAKPFEAVDSHYRNGAVWIIGKGMHRALLASASGAGGDYIMDASTGMRTLFGYPVHVTDDVGIASTPAVAKDMYGYFGNFMDGLLYATYQNLVVKSL